MWCDLPRTREISEKPAQTSPLALATTVYSGSAAGFNLATKLNSFKEIGTVLPDPRGVAETSSSDQNCTISDNLNT